VKLIRGVCRYYWLVIGGLLLAGAVAGCSAASEGAGGTGAPPGAATATVARLPTVPSLPTSTEVGAAPTSDPTREGLPIDVTGYELIATSLGEAVYSGYACTIAPVGCACEEPVIQKASFAFVSEGQMSYTFSGSGYGSEWLMTRIGRNQWSYTIPMYRQDGTFEGAFFVLLTFTEDGFIITQGADLDEGGMVACPDVYFRRLMSDATPEP
jgi:hypothetical protein